MEHFGKKHLFWTIVIIILAPFILTRSLGLVSFDDTGQIGDTIGGTTAPIIGIVSIYLLYRTLKEQAEFNGEQSVIAHKEQFKSTFFQLLQEQRDISDRLQGTFYMLNETNVRNKKSIEASGLNFFFYARKQLNTIFDSLDNPTYCGKYHTELAYEIETSIDAIVESTPFLHPNVPEEERQATLTEIYEMRRPFHYSYINTRYRISESIYQQYQKHTVENKIKLGYALFYNQHENVGHYFRHLYQVLKYVKDNEDAEVAMHGSRVKGKREKKIRDNYRQYAQFIQAQMSIDELYLLFYDSFLFPKLQGILLYYKILENLTVDNLANISHNCLPKMHMKEKKNFFKDLIS